MRRVALLIALGLLVTDGVSVAQPIVSGRVVADDTGNAIPNARVSLIADSRDERIIVLTDPDGRFSFDVRPGRYRISASKTRYAQHEITFGDAGQPVEIRLPRAAAIFGRVVDDGGEPVIAARVTAETPAGSVVATSETDDRGEYRLGSLRPDTFVVAVTTTGPVVRQAVAVNQVVSMPSNFKGYYPGVTTLKEAERIAVRAGDERGGIDFIVPMGRAGNQPFSVLPRAGAAVRPGAISQRTTGGPTAVIRGQIVGTDGIPLPNALVRLLRDGSPDAPRIVRCGYSGQFEFDGLYAGVYRLAASKNGYFPADRRVDVSEDQTRERVDLTLPHWGTIEGRVVDERGDPLQGARVDLLQLRYERGRRRLTPASVAPDTTDDLGAYRLYGVFPGNYIVSAAVGAVFSTDLPGYARSYFPGTAVPAQAQFLSTATARELIGIDIVLSRAPTARVAGQMLNAAGEPTTGGSLTLVPSQGSGSATSISVGARIWPDGKFEFPNVPAGQYVIQAYRGRTNPWTEGEFGALPVTVGDSDLVDLVLRMSAGSLVGGRVSFDVYRGTKEPLPATIEILPVPVDFDLAPPDPFATASISANWGFVIQGINGPRRLQLTRAPAGWALKEIRVNGIDVTDQPLPFGRTEYPNVEIVLTDRINEVAGSIADDRGRPIGDASVILFSTDRARWYPVSRFVARTRSAVDGRFVLSGLPFGSYYAAALTEVPTDGEDAWQDPEFLESLVARASTVTLGDGQKTSITLRLARR